MWEWLKSLWEDPAENYAAAYLSGRDGDPLPSTEIASGKQYFTISLECMHLVHAREGITKFYGVFSGRIGFDLASGPEAITLIVSPDALKGVEKAQYERVIVQTVPLCEKIPYVGGSIDLRLALLSLEATNLLSGIVDVLTSVAKAAGIGYVEQAKTFLGPLEKGIGLLVRQGGTEIGLYKSVNELKTGYYCVARAPVGRLNLTKCRLSSDWELTDQNGKAITEVPYFVLRVQSHENKGNFARIPSIREAYAKLRDAVLKGKGKEHQKAAKEAFEFFRRTVIWSADLQPHDREEMIEFARKQLETSFPAQRTSAEKHTQAVAARRTFPQLEQLVPWHDADDRTTRQ
jgi:hypothetical protein